MRKLPHPPPLKKKLGDTPKPPASRRTLHPASDLANSCRVKAMARPRHTPWSRTGAICIPESVTSLFPSGEHMFYYEASKPSAGDGRPVVCGGGLWWKRLPSPAQATNRSQGGSGERRKKWL